MFDPLNIRYATDTTNMQLWNTHNPFRACLLCADGYMVLWDYKNAPFLAQYNPLVRESSPEQVDCIGRGMVRFYNPRVPYTHQHKVSTPGTDCGCSTTAYLSCQLHNEY